MKIKQNHPTLTLNYNAQHIKKVNLQFCTQNSKQKTFTWGTTSCKNVTTLSMYDCSLQNSKNNSHENNITKRPDHLNLKAWAAMQYLITFLFMKTSI